MDATPDPDLDRQVRLAATLCQCPLACLSFTDGQRHWSRIALGQEADQPPPVLALLPHVLEAGALRCSTDPADHPGWPASTLRFIACQPLLTRQGLLLGALTVADLQPRQLQPLHLQPQA